MVGWTEQVIDDRPLSAVMDLLAYWSECPPTHELLAARFDIRPKRKMIIHREDDRWWETIEEKHVNQDLGGFVQAASGTIKIQ